MNTTELFVSGHRCPEEGVTGSNPKGQLVFIEDTALEYCKGKGVDFQFFNDGTDIRPVGLGEFLPTPLH